MNPRAVVISAALLVGIGGLWVLKSGDSEGAAAASAPGESATPSEVANERAEPSLATPREAEVAPELEAEPEAPQTPDAESSAWAGHPESELAATLESFRTDEPDLVGLQETLALLAQHAEVEPSSLKYAEDGGVHGYLQIPAAGIVGTFDAGPEGVRLRMTAVREDIPEPFYQSSIDVGFQARDGRPVGLMAAIGFEPDTRRDPADYVPEGGRLVSGWIVSIGESGASARPNYAQLGSGPNGWHVGVDREHPGHTDSTATATYGFERWYALLGSYGAEIGAEDNGD